MTSLIPFDKNTETVGLVGCGRMGCCMLERILEAGYKVIAYDVFGDAAARAADMGAQIAQTPTEVAEKASIILMSLPGPVQLEDVLFGKAGMAEKLSDGDIVIDTSTVDPNTTRNNMRRVKEKSGAFYLDSPILGRPSATGKWMLPTGGEREALERATPILLTFASDAVLVGESGAGNALKLLNQLMFSCINAISAEVLAICDHVGIDKKIFFETVAGSSAATVSGLFREVGKNIISDDYNSPAFTVDLLIKDATLALDMTKGGSAPSVIAGMVQLYNEIAKAQGLGSQDTSALYKVFSGNYQRQG